MTKTHPLTRQPLRSDWCVFTVDELKADEKSSCVAGPFGSSISSKYFVDKGVPVIRGSNLTAGGKRFVSDTFVYVSKERAKKYAAQHVVEDDLVFTCWGSIGHIGIIPKDGLFEEYIISNKQLKLRVNKDIVRPLYAYLYFASSLGVDYVKSYAKGAAVPGISLGILKGLEVAVPPLSTQDRIVSLISAYDDLIDNNTRRIEILEEMARRLFEEWFVLFRFPGYEEVSFRESELGEIPQGWEVVTIGNLVNIRRGKNITKQKIEPGDVPVVAGGLRPAYYHSTSNTKAPLLTISASGANAGHINLYHEDVWASDCSFIDSSESEHVYYYYLLLKVRQEEVTNLQRGSAQPHVYSKDVMGLQAVKAPMSLVESFMSHAGPLFRAIRTLLIKNTNLRDQRDLLLPRMVSGEIDVSDIPMSDDKEVKAA